MSTSTLPLVSVIVPCYNYAHFLPETVASLQQQSYVNWECIIVDDGSKDNTREVSAALCKTDNRVRYIYQDNAGLSSARNTGLRAVQGKYVQLLDADDLLSKCKLELNVAFLEAHPDVDVVYGKVRYFVHGQFGVFSCSVDMQNQPWMPCVSGKGVEVLKELIRENIMVVNAPMLRRELIKRVGDFDEELRACEDWHYWIRCAAEGGRFTYDDSNEVAALVRAHPISMINESNRMLQARILMRLKVNTLPAVTNNKDIRIANTHDLLALLAKDDFLHLYQGNFWIGVKGLIARMARWKSYQFFIVNGLYWFMRRFRNA
ncbi:glycosyltransferase family 2 protein [Hymenobacter oligotrophus]|uniref:Glycosyltransferase family 2 protein n=1 Tax=Hymenobacter oligotrophus TaxID=2319843 RepID=A0A3B7R199_9BACT|nr:glycosyltransferase family A protein [Hymenobacter oligotrophus]AYA37193.1 glycosyltransferase family 2 protein [Hymenobacter oligotrophus]